jgi:hypothetical protein
MLKIIFQNSLLLLFLGTIQTTTYAQKFYIETGLSNAYFKDYINNLGENTLDLNYSKPEKPFLDIGYRLNIYKEILEWDIGTNYSTYQIKTAFSSGNIKIPTQYDLNYVSLKTGLNVTLIKWRKIKLQIHSHYSYDWLTFGTNSYQNRVVDIYKEKTLDRTLFRYHRGAIIQYEISKKISTYINYNVAESFKEKNKDSNNGEEYVFKTQSVSFGLLYKIEKFNTLKK